MILGSKSLSQMTRAEMELAISELRESREALRAEAIREKATKEAQGFQDTTPRTPKAKRKKEPSEADLLAIEMLKFLKGES